MKYMILMQFSAQIQDEFPPMDTWAPEEITAHIEFMNELDEKLTKAGERVDSQGLADSGLAKIVRAGDGGTPVVTDGPFPETKEFLVGYMIVDVESEERAIEHAAYMSAAPGPGGKPLNMPIEVRQIMSAPSEDM